MKCYASPNEKIVSALKEILPVGHLQYLGDASQYCIFRVSSRIPEIIGSGKNQAVGCYGYIDLFSDSDESGKLGLVGKIEMALSDSGISVRSITDVGLDDGIWHTEFEVFIRMEVS